MVRTVLAILSIALLSACGPLRPQADKMAMLSHSKHCPFVRLRP